MTHTNNWIHILTKKQPHLVALAATVHCFTSSTETKYKALSDATRESVWINILLGDLGVKHNFHTTNFCDNESDIKLAFNLVFHQLTKLILAHYHYSREKVESGEIQVMFKPSHEQLADLLKKPLRKSLFEKFRDPLQFISSKFTYQFVQPNETLSLFSYSEALMNRTLHSMHRSLKLSPSGINPMRNSFFLSIVFFLLHNSLSSPKPEP